MVEAGYFQGGLGTDIHSVNRAEVAFGGIANQGWHAYSAHGTGFGGSGGKGGTVVVSKSAKVYAYNGNLYTDGKGNIQCPIYLQAGIYPAKYDYIDQGNDVSCKKFLLELKENQETKPLTGYTNPDTSLNTININSILNIQGNPLTNVNLRNQGIGSGAGYYEYSNGTYTEVN